MRPHIFGLGRHDVLGLLLAYPVPVDVMVARLGIGLGSKVHALVPPPSESATVTTLD